MCDLARAHNIIAKSAAATPTHNRPARYVVPPPHHRTNPIYTHWLKVCVCARARAQKMRLRRRLRCVCVCVWHMRRKHGRLTTTNGSGGCWHLFCWASVYVGMLGMLARSRARWVFIIWYLCDSLAVARKRGKNWKCCSFLIGCDERRLLCSLLGDWVRSLISGGRLRALFRAKGETCALRVRVCVCLRKYSNILTRCGWTRVNQFRMAILWVCVWMRFVSQKSVTRYAQNGQARALQNSTNNPFTAPQKKRRRLLLCVTSSEKSI